MRGLPLVDCKAALTALMLAPGFLRYSENFENGAALFRHACAIGLEGVISKRRATLIAPAAAATGRRWNARWDKSSLSPDSSRWKHPTWRANGRAAPSRPLAAERRQQQRSEGTQLTDGHQHSFASSANALDAVSRLPAARAGNGEEIPANTMESNRSGPDQAVSRPRLNKSTRRAAQTRASVRKGRDSADGFCWRA
jgi:hypothetical protein